MSRCRGLTARAIGAWGMGHGALGKKYVAGHQSERRRDLIFSGPMPRPRAPCPLRFLFLSLGSDLEHWRRTVGDARFGHANLDDVIAAREIEHHVQQDLLEDGAQAASTRTALQRLVRHRAQR